MDYFWLVYHSGQHCRPPPLVSLVAPTPIHRFFSRLPENLRGSQRRWVISVKLNFCFGFFFLGVLEQLVLDILREQDVKDGRLGDLLRHFSNAGFLIRSPKRLRWRETRSIAVVLSNGCVTFKEVLISFGSVIFLTYRRRFLNSRGRGFFAAQKLYFTRLVLLFVFFIWVFGELGQGLLLRLQGIWHLNTVWQLKNAFFGFKQARYKVSHVPELKLNPKTNI